MRVTVQTYGLAADLGIFLTVPAPAVPAHFDKCHATEIVSGLNNHYRASCELAVNKLRSFTK